MTLCQNIEVGVLVIFLCENTLYNHIYTVYKVNGYIDITHINLHLKCHFREINIEISIDLRLIYQQPIPAGSKE